MLDVPILLTGNVTPQIYPSVTITNGNTVSLGSADGVSINGILIIPSPFNAGTAHLSSTCWISPTMPSLIMLPPNNTGLVSVTVPSGPNFVIQQMVVF